MTFGEYLGFAQNLANSLLRCIPREIFALPKRGGCPNFGFPQILNCISWFPVIFHPLKAKYNYTGVYLESRRTGRGEDVRGEIYLSRFFLYSCCSIFDAGIVLLLKLQSPGVGSSRVVFVFLETSFSSRLFSSQLNCPRLTNTHSHFTIWSTNFLPFSQDWLLFVVSLFLSLRTWTTWSQPTSKMLWLALSF